MKNSLMTILFLMGLSTAFPAKQEYDSLKKLISVAPIETKINAMITMAGYYEKDKDLVNAEKTLSEAILYIHRQRVTTAETNTLEIQVMLQQARLALFSQADYNKSLAIFLKVLSRAKTINDIPSMMQTNLYLGLNYRFLHRYQESMQFLDQAISQATLLKDTGKMVTAMNEKANDYYLLKDLANSKELRLEALELAKKSGSMIEEQFISHDLAILYVDTKEYHKALKYFLLAYQNAVNNQENRRIAIIAGNIADAYLNLNQYDSALFYLAMADTITQKHNLPYERSFVYQGFSQYYARIGKHQLAFDYLSRFIKLNDSIFNLEKERQIAEITARYQSEKMDQENQLLRAKINNTFTVRIFSTLLILIFVLIVILDIRKRRKVNRELAKQNAIISNQKDNLSFAFDLLRSREKELKEANQAKDVFFSIIAHDLKGPFNALLGFSNLLRDDYDSFTPEERKKFIANIAGSAENIFLLLENLLAWSRTQTNRIIVTPETFDLTEEIQTTLEVLMPLIQQKQIKLIYDPPRPVMITTDKGMIGFVIRNLLSNAIKYVNRDGEIRVGIESHHDQVKVGIIDNGVGLSDENLARLFRIDSKIKTSGTANETGTGLGLIVCKEFIEKLGGEIWAESVEGEGSRFYFTIISNGSYQAVPV